MNNDSIEPQEPMRPEADEDGNPQVGGGTPKDPSLREAPLTIPPTSQPNPDNGKQ